MNILVTGGAGFIGSELVRQLVLETEARVINLDALTYAGNLDSLAEIANHPRYVFEHADLRDGERVRGIFETHQPDAVMHLAAESHVDRSIEGPEAFIQTNVIGTYRLLDAALHYWRTMPEDRRQTFRFLHVSTDEVYGSLGAEGLFTEETSYHPNSPYSASKAASDHMVRAWEHTYGLPTLVTNCSNNYGPRQFPEKLIPLIIRNAVAGKPLPIYGKGDNVRDWLYVADHARALRLVLEKGQVGRTYNIGGNAEKQNIDVVRTICSLLDQALPTGSPYDRLITFVPDRPGHDQRYAIDASRIHNELGWLPQESFETGLKRTVQWYLDNTAWCDRIASGKYRGERLGLERKFS